MARDPQDIALRCVDVDKFYPVQAELRIWRTLFGAKARGKMVHALRGISLSVARGTIVGILGKNGAGKSTLLRVLGGVYQPTKGRVEVHGQVVGLFELGGMGNPNLTGREYVTRYLRVMGARSQQIPELLEEIRNFSELEGAFDHRVRTYSSGMAARLYFAAATALQHEIYLIDELLSVGDEHFQAKCWRRMRQRLLNGASGVLVTHDWTAILRLCQQTHVMERGQFSFSGPSDEAVVSYLQIPVARSDVAKFSPCNLQSHVAESGRNASFRFWVDILQPAPVDIAVSVEILRIGIGWEIVLLSGDIPVAEEAGRYAVNVDIPELPLVPGEYSLNVFLSRRKVTAEHATVGFDVRSWTMGNGYRLQVHGEQKSASVRLPFTARKLEEVA